MTLQQLKYAVVTAEKGTVSEAAAALYIAQPSLTKAIKELEKESLFFTVQTRVYPFQKKAKFFSDTHVRY
jgi:DNA-binding MarR family transcriptional regulator